MEFLHGGEKGEERARLRECVKLSGARAIEHAATRTSLNSQDVREFAIMLLELLAIVSAGSRNCLIVLKQIR